VSLIDAPTHGKVDVGTVLYKAQIFHIDGGKPSVRYETYEVTKLTPCGFHVKWAPTERHSVYPVPWRYSTWLPFGTYRVWITADAALRALIAGRKKYAHRLRVKASKAEAMVGALICIKNGEEVPYVGSHYALGRMNP